MLELIRNPYTGLLSAGYRFRFQLRSISHHTLYLPLEMKSIPPVQALLNGVSPLEVFDVPDLKSARKAFNELRKQFDFPFWAATEYYVLNIEDADETVPLILNKYQHEIADTFLRRYFDKQQARYIIGKSFGRCGVTTCVQAYILWRQLCWWPKHSNTCVASEINLNPIKTNLCRFLKREIVPQDKDIFLPKADGRRAFFNTFRTPDALRGIDFAYVHFANMSLWHDPDGIKSTKAYTAASGGLLPSYRTFLAMEGNIPEGQELINIMPPRSHSVYAGYVRSRYELTPLCNNPYFVHEVLSAIYHGSKSYFHLIHLDPLHYGPRAAIPPVPDYLYPSR